MNKRERMLLIVVLAIVGSYALFVLVQRTFLGPLESQAAQVRSVSGSIALKRREMDEAVKASKQLQEWEKTCLPGDESTAQALYHDFLIKLMRDCHFEMQDGGGLAVDKVQKTRYYTSIPFTLRGKITLENLTEFMYRFYEPNLMHQIRNLTITPDLKSKNLSVTMTVAALALDKAPNRDQLLPEGDESRGTRLAASSRDEFQIIAKKNIFEPYREPPKVSERKDPEIDEAAHVRLTGCPQTDDEPEAWVYNRLKNERAVLRAGDELNMAGVKGKLVRITPTGIVLEIDNQEWSLRLGKSLRDMKQIAKVQPAAANGDAEEHGPVKKSGDSSPADDSSAPLSPVGSNENKSVKVGEEFRVDKLPSTPESEKSRPDSGT